MLHEYAFDVQLVAVARVKAESQAQAEVLLASVDSEFVGHEAAHGITITEVSLFNRSRVNLFEVDGKSIEGGKA
jgi:hypothetical protein